jgi:hypothetical protein
MFVVTYNTKYKTYITMSKSSTISLDVLNALSKGMLNASVKGAREPKYRYSFYSCTC